jgi:hypothetical protein
MFSTKKKAETSSKFSPSKIKEEEKGLLKKDNNASPEKAKEKKPERVE